MTQFLLDADSHIGVGGGYYFALMDNNSDGTTDSGLLAMDSDGRGVTAYVEFAGVTEYNLFDYSYIKSTLV
jgi:hypothetical protein